MAKHAFTTRQLVPPLLLLFATSTPVAAHSWVEYAYKMDSNGTMVGDIGYPRGYLPRNSTDPLWKDAIPQLLLPITGQSAYSGDEILNKYSYEANPQYPMLEACAGDYIALMHYENGHTTLPQNQPLKPQNRGTVYLYGTTQPKEHEKLFDVHLLWNQDGTGGDKRGRLLATRNYDDGQCYQPNDGTLSVDRAKMLADDGAKHDEELACQSDVRLPDDLKPGSVYTIYWYWDWPDLNAERIDFNATKNGLYPWAGSFMRGDPNPHHWDMDMISKNESYSSSIDIKIAAKSQLPGMKAKVEAGFVPQQDVYSKGIKAQMESNFQVPVDAGNGATSSQALPSSTEDTKNSAMPSAGNSAAGVTTVTVYSTVPPTTFIKTVYKTVQAGPSSPSLSIPVTTASPTTTSQRHTSTVVVTQTVHVPAVGEPNVASTAAATPTVPFQAKRASFRPRRVVP